MTVSQSSIDIRMLRPSRVTPALFTRMSIRPKSSRILALDLLHGGLVGDIDRVGPGGIGVGGVDFVRGPLGVCLAAADGSDARAFVSETRTRWHDRSPAPLR